MDPSASGTKRHFPQKIPSKVCEKFFFKLSVKCGRVNLGNPNHVQVLLEAFGAKLACVGAHML